MENDWAALGLLLDYENYPIVENSKVLYKESTIELFHNGKTALLQLYINNSDAVREYVCNAFALLRQTACKIIAKEIIKVIQPRKKTLYPYSKGDSTTPPWWPSEVEHKEPDHLSKKDRLELLYRLFVVVLSKKASHDDFQKVWRFLLKHDMFHLDNVKREIAYSIFVISIELSKKEILRKETVDVIDLHAIKIKKKTAK